LDICLVIVLTEVALLFVMPKTVEFTTAEAAVVMQSFYVLLLAFFVGLYCDGDEACAVEQWHIFCANVAVTLLTITLTLRDYFAFRRLVRNVKSLFLVDEIKNKETPLDHHVGSFERIDEHI